MMFVRIYAEIIHFYMTIIQAPLSRQLFVTVSLKVISI